jgi:hypothetical protein
MEEARPEDDRSNFELTHHVVPGEPGRDHIAEMAEAFVIEFKRMRWTDKAILTAFRNPFYVGPHHVYTEKGEEFVLELLESVKLHSNTQASSSQERSRSGIHNERDPIW